VSLCGREECVQAVVGCERTVRMNRFVGTNKGSRKTWRKVHNESAPLLLPVAHDALTARLIELAGYPAYQIGGFALVGSRFAYPDIDLAQFGENCAVMRDTIAASSLPVLVDADDAYGDAKNVTRVVQGYEAMGASAIFLEDQQAPKRCGHMLGKKVVPAEVHAGKIRAAVAARHDPETFIMARTDALGPLGLDEALRRAELYLEAGADGVYIEAVETAEQLEKVGQRLRGVPLATSIIESSVENSKVSVRFLIAVIIDRTSLLSDKSQMVEILANLVCSFPTSRAGLAY
jgi:2-methylisocitrate lyase-like PEP mutase family enzyme